MNQPPEYPSDPQPSPVPPVQVPPYTQPPSQALPPQPGMYPQQQPYFPPQPPFMPPPKKKSRTWLWIVGMVLVAVIFYNAGASSAHNDAGTTTASATMSDTSSTSSQPAQPTQAPAKPTTPPKPTVAPKWTTTQNFNGNGEKKTGTFTVSNDWKISWTCNPASFMGNSYNVIITVYNSDGTMSDLAINSMCSSKNLGGTTEEHQSGQIYLDISSEGDWSVTVQQLE